MSQRTADGYTGFDAYQAPDMLALQLERNEAGTTQAHYTIGQGLEFGPSQRRQPFVHYDHLGTTIALTASNQSVSDTYEHDAWGVLLSTPARPSTRIPTWAESAITSCPAPTSTDSASATTLRLWGDS